MRVEIDVCKSLRKDAKLKRGGVEGFLVTIKYEQLPQFCFTCERIGHTYRGCPWPSKLNTRELTREFGPWMRAPTHRQQQLLIGHQWLREQSLEPEEHGKDGNMETFMHGDNGVIGKESIQSDKLG